MNLIDEYRLNTEGVFKITSTNIHTKEERVLVYESNLADRQVELVLSNNLDTSSSTKLTKSELSTEVSSIDDLPNEHKSPIITALNSVNEIEDSNDNLISC